MHASLVELEALPGENELPTDDGLPMESMDHRLQMDLLVDTLDEAWADRQDICVAGNLPLYFSAHQIQNNDFLGPDVMVVLATTRRQRKSWVVWQEGRTPDVVIELLSPSTEANDRGHKMQVYARTLHVGEYYLFDVVDGRFEGYELAPRQHMYTAMTPDPDGGITSRFLGLRLVPTEMTLRSGESRLFLRWYTLDGELLRTGHEAALAERTRAEAEKGRAEAERARADALAEQLRALGITPQS